MGFQGVFFGYRFAHSFDLSSCHPDSLYFSLFDLLKLLAKTITISTFDQDTRSFTVKGTELTVRHLEKLFKDNSETHEKDFGKLTVLSIELYDDVKITELPKSNAVASASDLDVKRLDFSYYQLTWGGLEQFIIDNDIKIGGIPFGDNLCSVGLGFWATQFDDIQLDTEVINNLTYVSVLQDQGRLPHEFNGKLSIRSNCCS